MTRNDRLGRFIERTGFGDGKGNMSFNKGVTTFCCWLLATIVLRKIDVPWPVLAFGTVVLGAGFGLKGYLGGISRNTATFNANTSAASTTAKSVTIDAAAVVRALPNLWRDDESGDGKP